MAREYFGLLDIEKHTPAGGILRVCVGDALSPSVTVPGGYAGNDVPNLVLFVCFLRKLNCIRIVSAISFTMAAQSLTTLSSQSMTIFSIIAHQLRISYIIDYSLNSVLFIIPKRLYFIFVSFESKYCYRVFWICTKDLCNFFPFWGGLAAHFG